MTTTTIIAAVLPSIVSGLFFLVINRKISRADKRREENDTCREKSQILILKSIGAAIALGEATALALQNGKTNGETEKALAYATQVKHEQKDFLTEVAAKTLY